jgi:hypothetical protein
MPITQDRFLTVIDGAARLLSYHRSMTQLATLDLTDDVMTANSVIAHVADQNARDIIQKLVNRILAIRENLLESGGLGLTDFQAVILAEQLHFAKVKGRNNRAAFYQKRQRENSGTPPRQSIDLPRPQEQLTALAPQDDFENTPEYKRFLAEMAKRREAEHTANAHDLGIEPSAPPQNIKPRIGLDGTIRYLPDDETLNAPPSVSSDENLL